MEPDERMLAQLGLSQIGGGINLVDIGSSGGLDPRWSPLERLVNLVGFDPNEAECERMNAAPHPFHSARYLPHAIAGERGDATLYRTRSIYCYSLLEPDATWLKRLAFGERFEVTGTETIPVVPLSGVEALADVDVDAIKIDTQGLELPILSNAGAVLDRAFYVETETGFIRNYHGETTYAQIDEFMRSRGFQLFDMRLHRMPRANAFRHENPGKAQLNWVEAVWLRDYVPAADRGELTIGRPKALKALLLCAHQGALDFGLELAETFRRLDLITAEEMEALRSPAAWDLPVEGARWAGRLERLFNLQVRLLPQSARRIMLRAVQRSISQSHLARSLLRRG